MDTLLAAFNAALGRFDGSNFDQLSETDQVLITIWGLEAEVNNGGFGQYYFNGAGDQAFFAPTALSLIGASKMAGITAEANAAFGSGGPPRQPAERDAFLDRIKGTTSWDDLDRASYEYPDDINALLVAYLRRHGVDV